MKVEHKACNAEIEVEHKARIIELETKTLGTPPMEWEAQVVELKGYAMTIDSLLVEMQNLLD